MQNLVSTSELSAGKTQLYEVGPTLRFSFFKKKFNYVYIFMGVCTHECSACGCQKGAPDPAGTEVTAGCGLPDYCGCWELNVGPL